VEIAADNHPISWGNAAYQATQKAGFDRGLILLVYYALIHNLRGNYIYCQMKYQTDIDVIDEI